MFVLQILVLLMLLIPACKSLEKHAIKGDQEEVVIDLTASTNIIMKLIQEDALTKVLEDDTSQEGIILLTRNFSPAEMAFEAEVLNYKDPVVVIFFKDNQEWETMRTAVMHVAENHKNSAKWVRINAEELFRIAEHSEIDHLPTMLVIDNREEIDRYEQDVAHYDANSLESFLQSTFDLLSKKAQ